MRNALAIGPGQRFLCVSNHSGLGRVGNKWLLLSQAPAVLAYANRDLLQSEDAVYRSSRASVFDFGFCILILWHCGHRHLRFPWKIWPFSSFIVTLHFLQVMFVTVR